MFNTTRGFVAEIEWTKSESSDQGHSFTDLDFMPKPHYKTTNWRKYKSTEPHSRFVIITRKLGETYTMIKALNKLTGTGMPETQYIV